MLNYSISLVVAFFSSFIMNIAWSQSNEPFAQMVDIKHACAGGFGSVEFEIIGNPDDYVYYWTHGPTELKLTGLEPGFYTFVVENLFGCKEEYTIEILLIDGCILTYEILPTERACWVLISLHVTTLTGKEIQEEALDILWADDAPFGLNRIVPIPGGLYSAQYCVDIEISGPNGKCCDKYECINIQGDPDCDRKSKVEVIVNEFNRREDGKEQFVELLVLGDGSCEDTFDLRGYILDDNNGDLIPGNEFVNEFNFNQIGINEGYLAFSYDSTWAEVPNGSLIVIYDEIESKHPAIPADDPEDSNHDGVYILPANSTGHLFAKSGFWNDFEGLLNYSGTLEAPVWEFITLTPDADGMQVRYPDGKYCHGLSLGSSPFASINNFPLYLTSDSNKGRNCKLVGEDYLLKDDFECNLAEDSLQTPGAANSATNAALVFSLKDCGERTTDGYIGGEDEDNLIKDSLQTDFLKVYPNPTGSTLYCEYYSRAEGSAQLRLVSVPGQETARLLASASRGKANWTWNLPKDLPSGYFMLEVLFPSGEKKSVSVIIIK